MTQFAALLILCSLGLLPRSTLGSPRPPVGGSQTEPVRILLDQAPLTIHPRLALDAASQRLGALLFRGLTRIDADLKVQPEFAASWSVSPDGLQWKFKIRPGLQDHQGGPITAARLLACFETYRNGTPRSPLMTAFPNWVGTEADSHSVTFRLTKPDPYLSRNVTLLRYFRTEKSEAPCAPEPKGAWIGSGAYRVPEVYGENTPKLLFEPFEGGWPQVTFVVSRDENTRALKLLRGEADLAQNSLSLAKTRWLKNRRSPPAFEVLEREGVNVSYLAFDLRDPVIGKIEVRKALALAIDRDAIIRYKMFGYGTRAESFLAPVLAESAQFTGLPFDPAQAERLLDAAGFPRKTDGIRLHLRYRTTPVREGMETALMLKEFWRKIGVSVELSIVEPGMFLSSIRKGGFQLYSSRWVGVADASILIRALRSGQPGNRVGIADPALDQMLDRIQTEPNERLRLEAVRQAQSLMHEKLPYFPLWYWRNALIAPPRWAQRIDPHQLSLSGAFEPLLRALKTSHASQSANEK